MYPNAFDSCSLGFTAMESLDDALALALALGNKGECAPFFIEGVTGESQRPEPCVIRRESSKCPFTTEEPWNDEN